jgi:hypothetical protein
VKESKAATGAVVLALANANRPILASAGSAAGRPTAVHADPSVE